MGQLKLKDLYIGKTDGYNEFLEYGSDVCRNLFFEYPKHRCTRGTNKIK